MPNRGLTPYDAAVFHTMPTKQLLGIRDGLLRLEESLADSDMEPAEILPGRVYFKDDPIWLQLHAAVTAELSMREHLPTAAERAARRSRPAPRPHHHPPRPRK